MNFHIVVDDKRFEQILNAYKYKKVEIIESEPA